MRHFASDIQYECGDRNSVDPQPLVDFLGFSIHIQKLKSKLMKMLQIQRDSFFVFRYRSGDFGMIYKTKKYMYIKKNGSKKKKRPIGTYELICKFATFFKHDRRPDRLMIGLTFYSDEDLEAHLPKS